MEAAESTEPTETNKNGVVAAADEDVEVIDLTNLSDSSSDDEHENGGFLLEDDDELGDEDEDDDEVEIQLNQETRAQLCNAISTVSEARLRHVLKSLIETDQSVEIALTREFITIRRETQAVVPRWDRCMQCDIEFDINTRREDDECAFHPGDLEVDEEAFGDWDDDTHGPKDTHENRQQYPEEFKWTCCAKDGTAAGCVRGEHKPMEVSKKRKRSD